MIQFVRVVILMGMSPLSPWECHLSLIMWIIFKPKKSPFIIYVISPLEGPTKLVNELDYEYCYWVDHSTDKQS